MCEDEISFEEIKSKIVKDFEPVLKNYEELKSSKINGADIEMLINNLKNSINNFSFSCHDKEIEISFSQAHYQNIKDKELENEQT